MKRKRKAPVRSATSTPKSFITSADSSLSRLSLDDLEITLRAMDEELAARLKANPLRLIRHPTQGIIPLRLFKKQLEFVERFERVQKLMGWVGPNRVGKSLVASSICVSTATGWPISSWCNLPWDLRGVPMGPPVAIGCITVSKGKSIDGQQKYLAERIPDWMLTSRPWNKRTGFGGSNCSITLRNGSTFDFLSDLQRDQQFEAFSWKLVWIDEAVDEWVMERIYSRLVDFGGKAIITALLEKAWLDRLLNLRLPSSDSNVPAPPGLIDNLSESTMFDNELLARQSIQETIALLGGAESRQARMRVWGQNVMREGLVFDTYDPLLHELPALEVVPANWTKWEGADPGYANPFGWLFIAIDPGGVVHVVRELYEKRSLVPDMAAKVKKMRKAIGYAEPVRPAIIDPAADEEHEWGKKKVSVRRELNECGIVTLPGEAGPGSVDAGNQLIRAYLAAGKLKIHANCQWMKFEFHNYREGPRDKATGEYLNDKEKVIDAHNHLIAALRYFFTAMPHYVPPSAVPSQQHSWNADLAEIERAARAAEDSLFD